VAPAGGGGGESFGASLARLVDTEEQSHNTANTAVGGMLNGQVDVHDAMIALQRADLTLQFGVQVRNKLMNAYQVIMRMPV
jgi:flagellar hook-basal body complex protein FliE